MSVQCLEPKFYNEFLEHLGLSDDADFRRQHDRSLWPALADRLSAVFATRSRAEWTKEFLGTDACVAPVLNPEEAMNQPINEARATWHEVDGVLQSAPAPRFADAGPWSPPPRPARGEHSAEILSELAGFKRKS